MPDGQSILALAASRSDGSGASSLREQTRLDALTRFLFLGEALAGEVVQAATELMNQQRTALICSSRAARCRDTETGAYIQRMARYCRHIARNPGMPGRQQALPLDAAPMHDAGKVGVPDAILLKPARLEPHELVIMQQHAAIGHAILIGTRSLLLDMAAQIAHTRHEKYDGTGCPRGLAGEQIVLGAALPRWPMSRMPRLPTGLTGKPGRLARPPIIWSKDAPAMTIPPASMPF